MVLTSGIKLIFTQIEAATSRIHLDSFDKVFIVLGFLFLGVQNPQIFLFDWVWFLFFRKHFVLKERNVILDRLNLLEFGFLTDQDYIAERGSWSIGKRELFGSILLEVSCQDGTKIIFLTDKFLNIRVVVVWVLQGVVLRGRNFVFDGETGGFPEGNGFESVHVAI